MQSSKTLKFFDFVFTFFPCLRLHSKTTNIFAFQYHVSFRSLRASVFLYPLLPHLVWAVSWKVLGRLLCLLKHALVIRANLWHKTAGVKMTHAQKCPSHLTKSQLGATSRLFNVTSLRQRGCLPLIVGMCCKITASFKRPGFQH